MLNITALTIQCFIRTSLSIKKFNRIKSNFINLQIREEERLEELSRLKSSELARKRDLEKTLKMKEEREMALKWKQQERDNILSIRARQIVRRISRHHKKNIGHYN